MQKLQEQFSKILKRFSTSPDVPGSYNPECSRHKKWQWSRFQLKSLVCILFPMWHSSILYVCRDLLLVDRCSSNYL
jgi:hypothetical protein